MFSTLVSVHKDSKNPHAANQDLLQELKENTVNEERLYTRHAQVGRNLQNMSHVTWEELKL
jgi:hypothetical protein